MLKERQTVMMMMLGLIKPRSHTDVDTTSIMKGGQRAHRRTPAVRASTKAGASVKQTNNQTDKQETQALLDR